MSIVRYSVADVPTVGDMMRSDAFIRSIMGPFGSGKSSGCVMDVMGRSVKQRPGIQGRRRSRWGFIRNCYDDQTEILTEHRGWVKFVDLRTDDAVATLKDGEELFFEVPSYYHAAPYKGEMIGLANEGIDLLVTPDHKLWCTKTSGRDRREMPYRFEAAERCYGMIDWRFKRDAVWKGAPADESLDFFEFLGFWFSNGTAGVYTYPGRNGITTEPRRNLCFTQGQLRDYAREMIERIGFEWFESEREDGLTNTYLSTKTVRAKRLVDDLAACGAQAERAIPSWIKNSSADQIGAFFEGYFKAGGHEASSEHDVTRICTASKRMADDLQEMALRCGCVANVAHYDSSERTVYGVSSSFWTVTFVTPLKYRPYSKKSWYKKDYDGIVYCLTVSSHIVYVRRNGKAVWCSQTAKQLEDTTLKTVMEWFPPTTYGEWRPSDMRYLIRGIKAEGRGEEPCEIEILFRALDREEQVGNLLSLDLTGAWVNEAREVPWTIIDAIQGRVGRFPPMRDNGGPTWFGVIMDTNPPDVDSRFHHFFEEEDHTEAVALLAKQVPGLTVKKYARLFKQPSGLSPQAENLANLPKGYYQRMAVGKTKEWIKVYVEGDYGFDVDGMPVFPEYDDDFHCRPCRSIDGRPIHRGWDSSGLTPACIFSQLLPTGQWIILDELVADIAGADRFSDRVLEHSAVYFDGHEFEDTGDPAGMSRSWNDERTYFEILHAKNINIVPGEQGMAIRLESVRKPLMGTVDKGRPQFVLHPRCKILRRAFMGGYHFRRIRVGGDRFASEPNKNPFSHPMDGLQYTATRIFGPTLRTGAPLGGRMPYDEEMAPSRRIEDRSRSAVTGY